MPRSGRRLASLLVAVAAVLPASAARANPLDDEVAARRAELDRRAGTPGAITPLLGILELWEWVDDRAAITALLDAARADQRQRADVRSRATYLRSIVADSLGATDEARALRGSLGLITDWQVLGPFDNEGHAGDRAVLPPEQDLVRPLDGKRGYPGKLHAVSWRRFPPRRDRWGMVSLDAALQPEQNVVGYATTFVRVDRDTPAALRVGSAGAITVWVNDVRALARDTYRPPRFDQDAAPVTLRAGWNRVTVKLGSDEGGWSFYLRFTAPDGTALPFEASAETARAAAWVAPRGKAREGRTAPVADLLAELRAAADNGAAAAQRDYGLFLHYVTPEDPRLGTAERVLAFAASVGTDVEGCRLASMVASDDDKARKWLEEGLLPARQGTKAERARVAALLGGLFDRLHRERRAEELWNQALALEPDYFPATLRLAELASTRGFPSRARTLLDRVAQAHGGALAVLRARAQLASRQGRDAEAQALYTRIAEASRDDVGALRSLESLARERGDIDAALDLLKRIAVTRPEASDLASEEAQLLDGVGRGAEAIALLKAALDESPDHPALLELLGRVLHRAGKDDDALAAIRRSLELHPQDPQLRAYAAAIESSRRRGTGGGADEGGDDLAREFAVPVEDLLARAARAPRPDKDPAWVLLDRQATRVHGNGLSQSFNQRVIQVLDERGAREQGQSVIRYSPDSQSVEVKAARVHKPSGEVVEAAAQSDEDTSEPWYGLYYDTRAQVIELPHLEPGDVIDIEYIIADVSARNMFGSYFGDMQSLAEDLPRLETDYVLIAPRSRKLYFNKPEVKGARRPVELTESDRGDERIYRFHAEGVPRIRTEPGMPGLTSLGAYVHVSTFESWEQMAEWYRGLVREQLEPDDEIRKAVKATLSEVAERAKAAHRPPDRERDEREKIGAIYDLVVKSTRYVGLEFGIHGYKPYRVSQVFQRKFGDCKDKASLLVAMLKLAGVDASLVLVRTRRGGDIATYPASLAPFDHAIAWVPRYDLFLDGTAEFSGSGELPAQDQDVPVLIVSDPRTGGRGHLVRTPVPGASHNRVVREQEVTLLPSGDAQVQLRMEVAGQSAHEWRSHYQSPGERRERLEKAENGAHPGARALEVEFPSLEELEQPVRMKARLEVPTWARTQTGSGAGTALSMPALGREGELSRSYARLSERQHDLILGYPWQQEDKVVVTLPEGWSPSRMPAPQKVESRFGRFTLAAVRSGRTVTVTGSLEVQRHRIAAADYPDFRRFCLEVDRAAQQQLVVSHD